MRGWNCMFRASISRRVTADDGCALFFLCARAVEKDTDDPSPPVTSKVMESYGTV